MRDLQGVHIHWGSALLPAGGLNSLKALKKLVHFSRSKDISIYIIFRLSSVLGT